jgi:hypothetical protein
MVAFRPIGKDEMKLHDFNIDDANQFKIPSEYLVALTGLCRCGAYAEEIRSDMYEILCAVAYENSLYSQALICSDKYHELLAKVLDSADILNHGTDIGSPSIDEKVKTFLKWAASPPSTKKVGP